MHKYTRTQRPLFMQIRMTRHAERLLRRVSFSCWPGLSRCVCAWWSGSRVVRGTVWWCGSTNNMEGASGVYGRCASYAGCVAGHAGRAGTSGGWCWAAGDASACGFGMLYGPVHGCPQDRRWGWPGARTYSGQGHGRARHARSFSQVRTYVEVQAGAVCKTVGSAYVGSNPTPATRFRSSEPVTRDCVTGVCAQRERFIRPSAVVRGLCVGQVRLSAAAAHGAG
jgi:hypothetical protein